MVMCARKILLATILWCSLNVVCNATELNADFVSVLNGDAQIRYFKVGFPGDLFIVNGEPINGEVYYEGSMQKDTFWVGNCTNSPPLSGQINPGAFIGASYKDVWTYRDDAVSISPKDSKVRSVLDGQAQQICAWAYKACGIGLMIKPGTFHLQPDNTFDAEDANNGHAISGHFEVGPNGFPTRCEYTDRSYPGAKAVAEYSYPLSNNKSQMPNRITTSIFNGSTNMGGSEYQILACDFGSSPLPPDGYTVDFMTNFGHVNLQMRDIAGTTVFRDGLTYRLRHGQLTLTSHTRAQTMSRMRGRRMIIILLMMTAAILPLWLIARTKAASVSQQAGYTK
jgi:hypothetical protein